MMTWISEQAKWVIYISIVFILAGLLFMDMSQLSTDKTPPVAKFGDDVVLLADYQARLQETQARMNGRNMTEEQTTQMRQELLSQMIIEKLQEKTIQELKLAGSDAELWADLMNDPIPGVQQAAVFKSFNGTDSVFDLAKYRAWLDTSIAGTIVDPQLIQYREFLRMQKIPQRQLQMLVMAGYHPSTLESKWSARQSQTRFDVLVASMNVDSIATPAVDSAEVQAYFTAQKDSFFVVQDLAKADMILLPISPSMTDIKSSQEWATMMLNQIKEGADFAELAKLNSDDSLSAAVGGEVADVRNLGAEVISQVATLDSGAIAPAPIRTADGFHIVQVMGKADTTGAIKARQIFVKITAGTETVDSLLNVVRGIKEQVDAGKPLAEAAKGANLTVQRTDWLAKGSTLPGVGFVQGLSSYLFRNPELSNTDEVASPILQNKLAVMLAVKAEVLTAGTRVLEPYKAYISARLAQTKRVAAAKASLEKQVAVVTAAEAQATDSSLALPGNIQLRKLSSLGFEGFIPGLGFASPEVYSVLSKQSVGQWGKVIEGQGTAVMVKLLSKSSADDATVTAQAKSDVASRWQYGAYNIYNDFIKNLQGSVELVNNLDLYYNE